MSLIDRETALEILSKHGLAHDDNTTVKDGNYLDNTSFDNEVGIKELYTVAEIYQWLGY